MIQIVEYCRQLEAFQVSIGIPRADRLERFCIGLYQIEGAINWQRSECEWESYASATIHFVVVMESLDFHIEKMLDNKLDDILVMPIEWKPMMMRTSRAIRNLFYARQAGATIRSKRYDAEMLEADLSYVARQCLYAIPTTRRKQAFHDATEILAKRV